MINIEIYLNNTHLDILTVLSENFERAIKILRERIDREEKFNDDHSRMLRFNKKKENIL